MMGDSNQAALAQRGGFLYLLPSAPELIGKRLAMISCTVCGRPLSWTDDLFSRSVHDTCQEIHGYIGHFKLSEWWVSTFDADERQYIELAFAPLGIQIIAEGSRST